MQFKDDEFLWVEKYRPRTISEVILEATLKAQFQQFVDQRQVPNLVLAGGPGIGKTTVAKAMLEEISCDYIVINGSLNRGIDVLRNEIQGFASTVSFSGGRKYVIIDEADNLTHDFQKGLRAFMEEFAKTCGFILTCNYINKLIPALQSRGSVIDFNVGKKEASKLAQKFFKRACEILTNESIKFDQKTVATLVQKHYPDWRRVLNELQRYSATGSIDTGIFATSSGNFVQLVEFMKDKNFTEARHWVKENLNSDTNELLRQFYDEAVTFLEANSIPLLVVTVAKYQYQSAFVADPEINIMAFLAECMINLDFK